MFVSFLMILKGVAVSAVGVITKDNNIVLFRFFLLLLSGYGNTRDATTVISTTTITTTVATTSTTTTTTTNDDSHQLNFIRYVQVYAYENGTGKALELFAKVKNYGCMHACFFYFYC